MFSRLFSVHYTLIHVHIQLLRLAWQVMPLTNSSTITKNKKYHIVYDFIAWNMSLKLTVLFTFQAEMVVDYLPRSFHAYIIDDSVSWQWAVYFKKNSKVYIKYHYVIIFKPNKYMCMNLWHKKWLIFLISNNIKFNANLLSYSFSCILSMHDTNSEMTTSYSSIITE